MAFLWRLSKFSKKANKSQPWVQPYPALDERLHLTSTPLKLHPRFLGDTLYSEMEILFAVLR